MERKRKYVGDDVESNQQVPSSTKKHSLDSDEEDSDEYEKDDINDSDIEGGEEDTDINQQNGNQFTPFNMREELQEGHFDKEGLYHWDKDTQVKDNWLDNVDWGKIKTYKKNIDSNVSNETSDTFNVPQAYSQLLEFMDEGETVQNTLQRLGKNRTKISSAERMRQKRLGIVDEAAEKITKFTALTNEILTRTGNMDIYQEKYEYIKTKFGRNQQKVAVADMYADDFNEKECSQLNNTKDEEESCSSHKVELAWEFKWKKGDTAIHGPFNTEQMLRWTLDNYFKDGVYVRKVGDANEFYSSKRMDFELYL